MPSPGEITQRTIALITPLLHCAQLRLSCVLSPGFPHRDDGAIMPLMRWCVKGLVLVRAEAAEGRCVGGRVVPASIHSKIAEASSTLVGPGAAVEKLRC